MTIDGRDLVVFRDLVGGPLVPPPLTALRDDSRWSRDAAPRDRCARCGCAEQPDSRRWSTPRSCCSSRRGARRRARSAAHGRRIAGGRRSRRWPGRSASSRGGDCGERARAPCVTASTQRPARRQRRGSRPAARAASARAARAALGRERRRHADPRGGAGWRSTSAATSGSARLAVGGSLGGPGRGLGSAHGRVLDAAQRRRRRRPVARRSRPQARAAARGPAAARCDRAARRLAAGARRDLRRAGPAAASCAAGSGAPGSQLEREDLAGSRADARERRADADAAAPQRALRRARAVLGRRAVGARVAARGALRRCASTRDGRPVDARRSSRRCGFDGRRAAAARRCARRSATAIARPRARQPRRSRAHLDLTDRANLAAAARLHPRAARPAA